MLGAVVAIMKTAWLWLGVEPLELYGKATNRFVAGFIGSPAMNFAEVTITEANGALTAESSGFRVLVPPARAGNLKAHKGQRVTLGIRPEDLHIATGADPARYTLATVGDVVEPLRSEILLDVKSGSNSLVARVEPTVRVKVHEGNRRGLYPDRR